ncbi:hypothetical protein AKJ52_01375 [candidate division MSBL1 archaeon SCGC-AAA382C18]|uniref:Resolvase HTH domain-containing protein n=1 Tax=candidate division MSBL1 archaeon SCGC-AAA382C18 TaxID=1698281 RepID=A0A133VKA1_9EURY|nr:hypothetical protein AKJ52_01375 [candidate division MSBL1 archaeon SCGC-AAA382C18]
MPRKVSDEDVEEMKSLRKEGLTYKEIAEEFNVSSSTVSRYLKNMKKDPTEVQKPPAEEKESKKPEGEKEKRKVELSNELKRRIRNFNEVGMPPEEIAKRLDLPHSKVEDFLGKEKPPGILDKLKKKLGIK